MCISVSSTLVLLLVADLNFLQVLVFVLITYFMAGLTLSSGAFFTFYILVVLGQATMTVFFRTLGCTSKNMDSALRLASIVIMLMILTSGYMVPYNDMRPLVRWFYWLNPLAYDFSAMMLNEFKDLNLQCVAQNLIPNGPGYKNAAYQVCTLAGGLSKEAYVDGANYLLAAFNFSQNHLKRNIAIMVAFIIGLLLVNVVVGEYITFDSSTMNVRAFKRRRKTLADPENCERQQTLSNAASVDIASPKSVVTWEGINYTVPISRNSSKQLLFSVSGFVKPGTMMALMGPSGAGKSTLLDVLSQRKTIGIIQGSLKADGMTPGRVYAKSTGYCEQADIHDPQQTVREALLFSACLRQSKNIPQDEKDAYVDQLIEILELTEVADALVGDSVKGLSVEERKRVTIGVELAAKPDVLLFLDEPTSGLDSQSALSIVRFLRRLTQSGTAIICTIHQPSAAVFNLFDRLLLLHHGRTIYCGPTQNLRNYLIRNGERPAVDVNIAEYALQMLTSSHQREETNSNTWAERWAASPEHKENIDHIYQLNNNVQQLVRKEMESISQHSQPEESQTERPSTAPVGKRGSSYSTSFWMQVKLVTTRAMLSNWRLSGYISTRVFNHVVIALLTGLTYLNVGKTLADIQYRIFVVFQVTVLPSLLLSQVEARYHFARAIFYREKSSQMYSSLAFVVANIISELPLSIVCSVVVSIVLSLFTNCLTCIFYIYTNIATWC